jgi:chromosome segregation ATPase
MGMTRFTLKGAVALIEDHQKSIRKLEAENDALKAELDRERSAREAYQEDYQKIEARAEKAEAHAAELEKLLGSGMAEKAIETATRIAVGLGLVRSAERKVVVAKKIVKKEAPR